MDERAATTSCTPRRTGTGAPSSLHVATVSTRYNPLASIFAPPTIWMLYYPLVKLPRSSVHFCKNGVRTQNLNDWVEWALQCSWGGLVVPLSPNSRILAIPMPCILKCNLWLPNSLMHCIYPGQKLNITRTTIWFLCVYQKTHPCFCFIYSAPVLIAERKKRTENSSTLRLSMLVVFCFNEWGIDEFAIPQTSFLPATS